MVLQPHSTQDLPGNLMAKVRIIKSEKNNAVVLPKSAILNDEVMKNFWVMKMINDSVAVKVPVQTGIAGTDSIEIISPVMSPLDRILISGNYGLGDTTRVRIIRHE
jgi:multidrug efflux pump subunit AcrA (membrane-fusion protein)